MSVTCKLKAIDDYVRLNLFDVVWVYACVSLQMQTHIQGQAGAASPLSLV